MLLRGTSFWYQAQFFQKKKSLFFFFFPSFSKKIQVPRKIFFTVASLRGQNGGESRLESIAPIHFLPFSHLNIEFCDFHGKIGDFAVFPLHHPPCLSSVYLNYPRNERKRTQQVSLFIEIVYFTPCTL